MKLTQNPFREMCEDAEISINGDGDGDDDEDDDDGGGDDDGNNCENGKIKKTCDKILRQQWIAFLTTIKERQPFSRRNSLIQFANLKIPQFGIDGVTKTEEKLVQALKDVLDFEVNKNFFVLVRARVEKNKVIQRHVFFKNFSDFCSVYGV